jgi:hypothetical protein
MNKKTFVFVYVTSFLLLIASIAAFNYKVDSHYLFSRSHLLGNAADALLSGRMLSGIRYVNNRYLHKLIIKKMQKIPNTIALGSSRSFLLRDSCLGLEETGSYFNHSLEGGRLKDYIAILGIYKRKGVLPAKILIEVTPRLFDKRSEKTVYFSQWLSIANEYYYFMNSLNYNTPTFITSYKNTQYEILKTKRLIAYSDTIEHFNSLLSGEERDYRIANCTYPEVFLKMPDGSLYYPFSKRNQYAAFTKEENRQYLKTMKGHIHQQSFQKMFIDLISYLEKNGTQVVFFLPPYNPYTYNQINKNRALRYVHNYERMILDLAKSKNIPVIGSYNPHIFYLSYKDFFDAVHINNDLAMERVFKNYQKVMDKNKFLDKDSNAGFDTVEPACSEYYWLEAEYADSIVNPLEVVDDDNASEGKYVYSANGTGNQSTPGPIMLTYTVHISHAGKYIMWGRVKISGKNDNSFFLEIDNGYDNLWDISSGNSWHWDAVNFRDRVDPVILTLFEGKHTIKVKLREDGTKLDKLLLTNDVSFIPSGEGGIAENQSSVEGN